MYSKILNMTMINTNPNPEYDMAKNTLLIESTIPLLKIMLIQIIQL